MSKIDRALVGSHDTLNPKIWTQDQKLRPDVHVALLRIAREFYEFLDFSAPLKDIQVTGSQANYNYTALSDLDLHLIVPYADVKCDQPVASMFDAKRKLWKERHTITIHGIPVEVYVEDQDKPVKGSTYSLLKDQWLTEPKPQPVDWDQDEVLSEVAVWLNRMLDVVETRDLDRIEQYKDQLKQYRKQGLAKNGEFGVENLAFKTLRNLGAVSWLMQISVSLKDQELSI